MSKLGEYILSTDVINTNVVKSIDMENGGGSGEVEFVAIEVNIDDFLDTGGYCLYIDPDTKLETIRELHNGDVFNIGFLKDVYNNISGRIAVFTGGLSVIFDFAEGSAEYIDNPDSIWIGSGFIYTNEFTFITAYPTTPLVISIEGQE